MNNAKKWILLAGMLLAITSMASADELTDLNKELVSVASALGLLVITHAGIRWIMADGPQERDDAKKTIIYVIVGLLVVSLAKDLVNALYCNTLAKTGSGSC